VLKPPTARNVRGIADAGVNDGWQHMYISVNVSSCAGAVAGAGSVSDHDAAMSSRRRLASSRRYCSISRREATRTSQLSGLSGLPSVGHVVLAATSASWTASSALAKSP
jgi:hypothetical protein